MRLSFGGLGRGGRGGKGGKGGKGDFVWLRLETSVEVLIVEGSVMLLLISVLGYADK